MQVYQNRFRKALLGSLACALLLAACIGPTDLPPRRAEITTESPGLLPLSQIVDRAADSPDTPRLSAVPTPRIAALQARAAQLRAPIIPAAEQQHMLGARDGLR